MVNKLAYIVQTLKDNIKPQNSKLRNTIPNHWRDKDAILEDFLFMVVISYIEDEKPFETLVLNSTHKRQLVEIYDYAKSRDTIDYCTRETGEYGLRETKYLQWIVKNRGILWT